MKNWTQNANQNKFKENQPFYFEKNTEEIFQIHEKTR